MKKQNKEIVEEMGKLNEVIIKETRRPNGTLRRTLDFKNCPTLAEQHSAHLTDLNYLIAKHKPDELAAYLAAREQSRPEIIGHDFTREPELMDAKTIVYHMKKHFEALPSEIKDQFKSHVEFLKFIDNPANQDKMIKLGLLKQKEIDQLTGKEAAAQVNAATTTTTQEAAEAASKQ
ncbi:internal scaffolding protein [Apis mellifera associated microvirus 33]|nr:internal scaffolding protein [Apis mellifera associated microvirus 33]